ncbi:MAG: hypothetical protein IJY18_05200 [Clostridia bacterium]|nr:hypothetical protein [Clostridia bacterium]
MKKRLLYIIMAACIALSLSLSLVIVSSADDGAAASLSIDGGEGWIEYESIEALMTAANGEYASIEEKQIKLLSDLELSSPLVFSEGIYHIILGGYKISGTLTSGEKGLIIVKGSAEVALNGYNEYAENDDQNGSVIASGAPAIYVGGESGCYPKVSLEYCNVSGDNAVKLGEVSLEEEDYPAVNISWGSRLFGKEGSAIVNEDLQYDLLPPLDIIQAEIYSKEGFADIDTDATLTVHNDMYEDTYIKTANFPNVLETPSGYSFIYYTAKSDIEISGDILPYGYYLEAGEGEGYKKISFSDTDTLLIPSGTNFFIGREDGYYNLECNSWVPGETCRVELGERVYRNTVKSGETVSYIIMNGGISLDDIVVDVRDGEDNKITFTKENTVFEGEDSLLVSFAMPESNASIFADLVLSITKLTPDEGGDFTLSKEKAASGDVIDLTVAPEEGYVLSKIYYLDGDSKIDLYAESAEYNFSNAEKTFVRAPYDYSFYMPDHSVSVGVEFKKGVNVYYRRPATEQWSGDAIAIYLDGESYRPAGYTPVTVDGEELYKYTLPEGTEAFFLQNYLTGAPVELIPGGPAFTAWFGVVANRVYDYVGAEYDPYTTSPEDPGVVVTPEGSEPETPPEGGEVTPPEGGEVTPPAGGNEGGEGGSTPEPDEDETPPADSENTPPKDEASEPEDEPSDTPKDNGGLLNKVLFKFSFGSVAIEVNVMLIIKIAVAVVAALIAFVILKKINEVFGDGV